MYFVAVDTIDTSCNNRYYARFAHYESVWVRHSKTFAFCKGLFSQSFFQIKTAQVICAANLLFYIVKRKRRNVKTSVVENVDERAAALRVAIHDALVGVVVYAHAVCQSYALIGD